MPSLRKVQRQKEAIEAAEKRASRSPREQLFLLDERLGVGQGAKKERERLMKMIKKEG